MKSIRIEVRLNSEVEKEELFKIAKKEGYKTFSEFFRAKMKKDFSEIYRSQLNTFDLNSENKSMNKYIKFNVTEEDKALFTKKAFDNGYKNISTFAREMLKSSLSEDYVNEIEQLEKLRIDTMRTRQAIANLSSNINQILKAYNSGEHPSRWIERDLANRENLLPEVKYLVAQNKMITEELDKMIKKRKV
ncbi:hypothetical protein [Aliarcobacter thereius]|uniref:Uncharacterized protein n=4 Tax=Aliarcobacter thereius TaxID=544718 RepID=A0A5R9H6P0_9BACT|nr:hypothetical protein [Aliarcobacter thereius]OCL90496.1 hypothetical protein AAX25_01590 [Aliarcobacter thereius]OCL95529.1 hypothetical protein AA347_00994 [Aliarcobacter thereius LMG 24486]OCL95709.1 hypothetical protein AA347_01188 [Aliarcobacter thereius LMG 24486]QBF16307.1 hypothetical protein ATH_1259 [Aliarcobacter thereius LMG 24486]QBF16484.1 hypothetical protein ATH_1453 [Aliarcobacter thereius LMG 24486]